MDAATGGEKPCHLQHGSDAHLVAVTYDHHNICPTWADAAGTRPA